jgi:hypothetical protein
MLPAAGGRALELGCYYSKLAVKVLVQVLEAAVTDQVQPKSWAGWTKLSDSAADFLTDQRTDLKMHLSVYPVDVLYATLSVCS